MSKIHGISAQRASSPDEPEPIASPPHPQQRPPNKSHAAESDTSARSAAVDSLVAGHEAASRSPSAASRFVAIQRPPVTSEPSILGGAYAETKTEQAVHNVAIVAARLGLPTKVLDAALQRDAFTDFSPLSSTSHIVLGNHIHLNEADSAAARDWNERSLSASTAVGTVYHEAIHQYLLAPRSEQVRQFVANGIGLYSNAEVSNAGEFQKANNPELVFHEAVASYAGHRISTWLEAYENLTKFARQGTLTPEKVAMIESTYNDKMAERVFGYETNGIVDQALGEDETSFTRQRIPEAVRTYVDNVLLEGRIPSRFRSDSTFQEYATLAARHST